MEENTSLWNKQANELTVGDTIKLVAGPIIVIGSLYVAGTVASELGSKALAKIRGIRVRHQAEPES